MGLPDIYPFILSPPVIEKLSAIHDLIHGNTLPGKAVPAPAERSADPAGDNPAGAKSADAVSAV